MKTKKPKRKNWTLTRWKKEFWRVFSIFIRMRDKGVCVTCQKKLPDYYDRYGNLLPGWKSGQAGHFITAKNCGLALYFHEKNVHCQCHHCNINLSGNWLEYEKAIIRKYGQEVCDDLKDLKWSGDVKYSKQDYEDLIAEYEDNIAGIELTTKQEVI